jgi:hypothetical protein
MDIAFSRRTAWPTDENGLTRAVRARRLAGEPVLDLTQSNPTTAGIHYPADLLAPLGDPSGLVYRPESLGHPAARAAVVAHYAALGVDVSAERIVITASTSEAYAFLFHVLCDAGDEILAPAPSYPLFSYLADLAGVRLVTFPLAYDGAWHLDLPALVDRIGPRTRAIAIVSPNNPTGAYLKADELAALRAIARERGLALISDEVFAGYPLREDPTRAPSMATVDDGVAFALSGLSKVVGLPQLKLGWIVVAGEDALAESALARLAMVADTFLSVATPVQLAASRLLTGGTAVAEAILARCRRNLAALRAALAAPSAATVLDVEGGWYAVVQVPATRSEEEWVLALLDRGVLVHPGHFFDFAREAFVVLSLLTDEPTFDAGIAELAALVE